jgi:hypothetical protein
MIKTVIVSSGNWTKIVKIDNKIFEDIYTEACTQAIESLVKEKQLRVASVINCCLYNSSLPKDLYKNMHTFNAYKILINAGMHKYAEIVREHFIKNNNIDWATEPLKNV